MQRAAASPATFTSCACFPSSHLRCEPAFNEVRESASLSAHCAAAAPHTTHSSMSRLTCCTSLLLQFTSLYFTPLRFCRPPRSFEIEFSANLNEALQALNITAPFTGGDLTKVGGCMCWAAAGLLAKCMCAAVQQALAS